MPSLDTPHHQPLAALAYASVGPIIVGTLMLLIAAFVSMSVITIALPTLLSVILIVGILCAAAVTVVRPMLYYFLFTYQVSEHAITINSGILFRQYETINFNRIQVIDNERSPILMLFGLTRVEIWTSSPDQLVRVRAGHRYHARPDTTLLLSKMRAEELKDFILHRPTQTAL